jgi:peptidoglycan/LPS O-acetylase OafA/YrhL
MPQELLAITIVLSASVLLAWLHYVLIEARVMAWREKIS